MFSCLVHQAKDYALSLLGKEKGNKAGGAGGAEDEADDEAKAAEEAAAAAKAEEEAKAKEAPKKKSGWGFSALSSAASSFAASVRIHFWSVSTHLSAECISLSRYSRGRVAKCAGITPLWQIQPLSQILATLARRRRR